MSFDKQKQIEPAVSVEIGGPDDQIKVVPQAAHGDGFWYWSDTTRKKLPNESYENYFATRVTRGPFTAEDMIQELLMLEPVLHPAIKQSFGEAICGCVIVTTPSGMDEFVLCAHDRTHTLETLNHIDKLHLKRRLGDWV